MTEFVSGWVGGACGFLFGHPFDTLKVRQQALNHTSIVFTFRDCIRQVSHNIVKTPTQPQYNLREPWSDTKRTTLTSSNGIPDSLRIPYVIRILDIHDILYVISIHDILSIPSCFGIPKIIGDHYIIGNPYILSIPGIPDIPHILGIPDILGVSNFLDIPGILHLPDIFVIPVIPDEAMDPNFPINYVPSF